ncbi:MAG: hypothetical protein MUC59_14525 [Saprospiraceae bacterium]|nr:hypothetical protein [Saprospiraceae bacterium]
MLKYAFRLMLGLALLPQLGLLAQETAADLPVRKYHIANIRTKLSLREMGLNLTPFAQRMPWLSIGAGYRIGSRFMRNASCLLGENASLNGSFGGPFVVLGYDSKNKMETLNTGFAAFVGYKHLSAGRYSYTESDCLMGSYSMATYKKYEATAEEVFFKFMLEKHNAHKQWRSLYFGLGGAFRQVKRAFIERGTVSQHGPDDDVEKVLYFIPLIDLGIRLNLFGARQ